jgi:predicted transcriptional regulator
VLKADRWTSKTKIREATGFGFDRIARGMRGLVESNAVATKRLKSKAHKGKAVDVYQLTVDMDALTNLV